MKMPIRSITARSARVHAHFPPSILYLIMSTRAVGAILSISCVLTASLVATPPGCQALLHPTHPNRVPRHHRHRRRRSAPIASVEATRPLSATTGRASDDSAGDDDDEALLRSVDPSTLQSLCEQYSLSASGTKEEMLARLREYANDQAELERERRRGRNRRVEANLEGKARHTIVEEEGFVLPEEGEEEMQGYFFYAAAETPEEKAGKEEERRRQKQLAKRSRSAHVTAPPPPENAKVNEKGERVVTVYSATDNNDLTGMTASAPQSDMSMENARYQQRTPREDRPEESLIGGPFGDTSGARRKKADSGRTEEAKEGIREVVRELLATTGAPAFRDDYEEGDESTTPGSFASPYGFTGFQPERIPPDLLSRSSAMLRAGDGKALREVLDEYELQAIGHDGMAADDASEGGGHYREVTKVGSFLEGYRKAEERRVARETATMLLDRLVKEGVKELDALLAGMVREGDDVGYVNGEGGAGELNGALVRYLEEAIREQEQRVKKETRNNDANEKVNGNDPQSSSDGEEEEVDLVWNVTRGDDGTIIETIDPNDPALGRMLRAELEKTTSDYVEGERLQRGDAALSAMTVQEKMLLLLKLLRDRVKVEAVVGNDAHARNLRILAYCLRAGNDEERRKLIMAELGNSLDSLDVFSDLVTASIDFAEARSNDGFMPGNRQGAAVSPVLNVAKLQKIKVIVERIKTQQSWRASGASP